ncbi:hypothetical protein [Runella salmonicolor]|uniref:Por secretion system C-terminal sorting domain-containing protein n=1 Tax=Runella salmonicolor TaxID=2950278 RepID=A0ABT1FLD4_9BACT|nr:hypothetical protein [Runella salmonicolor]MCP1382527.1 hypothetical protein [Runella salmonicolor]
MKTSLLLLLLLSGRVVGENLLVQSNVETATFMAALFPVSNAMKIRVLVSKKTEGKFFIRLKDEKGSLIYADKLPKHIYQHRYDFDLTQLECGKYIIEMVGNDGSYVVKHIQKEQAILAIPVVSNKIICLD